MNHTGDVCPLTDYGLLRMTGEDASTFLQGQSTCDVHALEPGHSTLGAFCTPKGRVIATFRLLRDDAGFYLLLAADLAAVVLKRLRMYVLRSKVILEDVTAEHALFGLFGPSLDSLNFPETPGTWRATGDFLALRLETQRGLMIATAEAAQRLAAQGLSAIDPTIWRLKTIEAGIPEVVAATREEFLPQMLNLDALGGIGWKKGCYTGQEIVTRTHYLGQVKRRMRRLGYADIPAAIPPGAAVYACGGPEPQPIGQVLMAAGGQVLAVVGVDHIGAANIVLGESQVPAEWLSLPYTYEEPSS